METEELEAANKAYLKALKENVPESRKLEEALMKKGEADLEAAMKELRSRQVQFYANITKEKEVWLADRIQKLVPLWVMRQVFMNNRGWILRLYGITIDKIPFSGSQFELFEIRKRGKIRAIKLFKWDDGEHLEGGV